MCSLVGVAGFYSKIELHNWSLWIAVDNTYNRIPGILGSHELRCTVLRANITSTLEIYLYHKICIVKRMLLAPTPR